MNFGLVRHVTDDVRQKTAFINEWNEALKLFFKGKEYGNDIESFVIGITCVSEKFEQFFKLKRPTYTESKIETHDGISIEIKKTFEYSLRLDYKTIINANDQRRMSLSASEIINSLDHFDSLPKKVKDFDRERFKSDLERFFKEQNLI
ncbi:hypothetical protein QQ020_26660 [Fulvivirgaceae bacterium BMA12]|uniref:Uncharacterized protein n=1 Tax=Agaribacillus aureus TaxID=3051825 RepID=A0ABT8LHD9_9BACT|nr:hypothetical protein [Fulvivirgaceae bacterium BMA12]